MALKKFYLISAVFLLAASILFSFNFAQAQNPSLSISLASKSPGGVKIPQSLDDVLYLNLAANDGDVNVGSLTFTEAYSYSTATNYKLYVKGSNGYELLSSGNGPVNNKIVFGYFSLPINAGELKELKIVANTISTISTYRLDLTGISMAQGEVATSLPVQGRDLIYTYDTPDPSLDVELSYGTPSGSRVQSSFQEFLKVDFTSDQVLNINSLTFEEVNSKSTAKNYRLYVDNSIVVQGKNPANGQIVFSGLDISLEPNATKVIKVAGDTTNTYLDYKLKLTGVTTEQSSDISGLPVTGNSLTFPIYIQGSLSSSSPSGTVNRGTSEKLIKFTLKPVGSDTALDNISFTQNNTNTGITDFKLYKSSAPSVPLDSTEATAGFSTFSNLNMPLSNNTSYTFEIRANTTNASAGTYYINIFTVSTTPLASIYGHGFPINGSQLNFEAEATSKPTLAASLISTSPSGLQALGQKTPLFKFNLTAGGGDVVVNELHFVQVPYNAKVSQYQIESIDDGTILDNNVSPYFYSGAVVFQDFDKLIAKGQKKTFIVYGNTASLSGNLKMQLSSISTWDPATISGLPLNGYQLIFDSGEDDEAENNESVENQNQNQNQNSNQSQTSNNIDETSHSSSVQVKNTNQNQTTSKNTAAEQWTEQERELVKSVDNNLTNRLKGYILLQTEANGEAWYVDPSTSKKYYLKDGNTAYSALRTFGLGITNKDLEKIPIGIEEKFQLTDTDGDGLSDKLEEALGTNENSTDTDGDGFSDYTEVMNNYNPNGPNKLPIDNNLDNRLKGKILLQVESKGEAWYVNPKDGKRYYMKDGGLAYQIMRYLSLGITNNDLRKISVGEAL